MTRTQARRSDGTDELIAAAIGIGSARLPLGRFVRDSGRQAPGDQARAGHPREVSHFAMPSDTGRYIGYWIGGRACACVLGTRRRPPYPDEGTWGWDFTGGLFRRNVDLGWWHGRRYQGGTGAYKTEAPKLLGAE